MKIIVVLLLCVALFFGHKSDLGPSKQDEFLSLVYKCLCPALQK